MEQADLKLDYRLSDSCRVRGGKNFETPSIVKSRVKAVIAICDLATQSLLLAPQPEQPPI